MAWTSLQSLKTLSTRFILTHTAVLFFRSVSFAQTRLHFREPCCGVVRLSGQDVKGEVAAQGQSARLRVREEHIKMHTNHVVCDQIQHAVPDVEATGFVVTRG